MSDDEIKKLEAERVEAEAALHGIEDRLHQARVDKATKDMRASGISFGDAVEVSTPDDGSDVIEHGILVGFEGSALGVYSVIMKMKKDGTASKRGRVFVWPSSAIRKLDQ